MDRPIRILLVEDSPADARLIRELLNEGESSYDLTHAVRLEDAISRMACCEADVILLDLSLPDSQGFETMRRMRAAAPNTALAILTGQDDERVALHALREGVEDYLVKGQIDSRLLMRAIRYAVERRRASNSLAAIEREREALLESERAARTDAERSNRLKDEFLAALSHELRTPLNAMLGWAQLLASRPNDDSASLRHGLETIARNARAQSQVIEDLLDMSRIVSGKLRLEVRAVDLKPLIEAAIATVRPAADGKGIRLTELLDTAVGRIVCDPHRIQQVLWNLLANAVKFTPPEGRIQVVLARKDSFAEIVVSDTGEGISPEFVPYVFDRFRQGDGSSTRRHGGLGLGLSIVRQIVELHGGTVQVSSGGVGRGATFTVSLPLPVKQPAIPKSEDTQVTDDTVHTLPPASLAGITVLVVDDDRDALDLVRRVLEDYQAHVITVGSAPEALVQLGENTVDVVVSDIAMPDMDGYELIRRIRGMPKSAGGDIPAAALTALGRQDDRTRALLAGYQTHVRKPVEPTELVAIVATLAGRSGHR